MSLAPPTLPGEGTPSTPQRSKGDNATAIIITVIKFFSALVEKFGWPGAVLIALGVATHLWASEDQKHQLVDMYILGKGMMWWWPLVVLSVLAVLVLWAQLLLNKKEVKKVRKELKRVGAEKSALQEQLANRQLRHGRPSADD